MSFRQTPREYPRSRNTPLLVAPLGVHLGGAVSETAVVLLFAALMLAVALRMLINARRTPAQTNVVQAYPAPDASAISPCAAGA